MLSPTDMRREDDTIPWPGCIFGRTSWSEIATTGTVVSVELQHPCYTTTVTVALQARAQAGMGMTRMSGLTRLQHWRRSHGVFGWLLQSLSLTLFLSLFLAGGSPRHRPTGPTVVTQGRSFKQ